MEVALGNRLASEVRRVDDYEVAAVPDLVVDVRQIPAGEFARTRIRRSEDCLTRSTRLRDGSRGGIPWMLFFSAGGVS